MPTDTKVGNPRAGAHGKTPNQKGKPLGIPKWGWIVGIALGLVIGYLVLKHSGSSSGSSSDTGSGPDSSPLGNSGTGSGGGASSGSPSNSDMLAARGITNIGTSDPGSVDGQGDSSTSTNPIGTLANARIGDFSSTTPVVGIANNPSVSISSSSGVSQIANNPSVQGGFGISYPSSPSSPGTPPVQSPTGNAIKPGMQM